MTDVTAHLDDARRQVRQAAWDVSPFLEGFARFGYAADIMIFDPATVGPDRKELAHDFPNGAPRWTSRPKGVHATIVNGVPIVIDGDLQADAGLPGQVLRPQAVGA